jgi:hypothetical protein
MGKKFDQTRGHADISLRAMDARWQWSKVCDVVVTPLGLWMLMGSGATPVIYIYIYIYTYMHLVKNLSLSQTYINPMTKIPT